VEPCRELLPLPEGCVKHNNRHVEIYDQRVGLSVGDWWLLLVNRLRCCWRRLLSISDNCCVREFLCEERRDLRDGERFRVRDL
jgi:hypothetical protein